MPDWFATPAELERAVADLRALGPAARRLLAEAVEAPTTIERTPSKSSEGLFACGFVHVTDPDHWTGKISIKSSLWGEEALDALEQATATAGGVVNATERD